MADKSINYKVNIDAGKSVQSLGQLEQEAQALNTALKLVKPNTQQFKELSTQAQSVQKSIKALNKEIEGISLEDKLDTADGAIKSLTGSTQALVGGFGLLGIESEKLEFLEGKAASAISFGMGLKDLSEGFGKLAKSTKVASAAQKAYNVVQTAFNAIMAMNPLGILIVSLTAVGALIYAFRDSIMNLIKTALGPFSGIIDSIVGAFTSLAESMGLVDDAATKLTKTTIKELDKQIKLQEAAGEKTLELQKKKLQEEAKLLEKGTDEYEENLLEQQILDIKIKKETDEETAKIEKEASDRRKEAAKAKKEEDKKNAEEALTMLQKYQNEAQDLLAKSDEEKLDLEYKRALAEIDALKISEEEKTKIRLQAEENYQTKLKVIKDNAQKISDDAIFTAIQTVADIEREIRLMQATTLEEERKANLAILEEERFKELDDETKTAEEKLAINKLYKLKEDQLNQDYDEVEKQNAEAKAQFEADIKNQSIDAIQGALATLFGESKAIASANVLIDAAQAGVAIMTNSQKFGPLAIPYQVSQFALLAATTASSLKQINSASPRGGNSSAAVPRGSSQIPNMSGLEEQIGPIDIAEAQRPSNEMVRAYVVSGDVTTNQEADAKLSAKRSIG
jgi:hypothetical protein